MCGLCRLSDEQKCLCLLRATRLHVNAGREYFVREVLSSFHRPRRREQYQKLQATVGRLLDQAAFPRFDGLALPTRGESVHAVFQRNHELDGKVSSGGGLVGDLEKLASFAARRVGLEQGSQLRRCFLEITAAQK